MTDSCFKTVARRARKVHHCDCRTVIQPGEIYLLHTEYPGGEAGYADYAHRPVRMVECRTCAERYGRRPLIAEREARNA